MLKKFLKNVLPSMLAFAFTGLYAIVDGFFVGNNVGDSGLAAVNLAFPLVALTQAVGTGIGMGGAIRIAVAEGKGAEEEKRRIFGNTIVMLVLSGVVVTAALAFSYRPLLAAFGASGITLELAERYISVIIAGAIFQIAGTGMVPLVRNYDGAAVAMLSMGAGFSINVFLDWLFVSRLSYGMRGAALATIIGQAAVIIPCCAFFAVKKIFSGGLYSLKASALKGLTVSALAPFGLTLSPNIVIIIMNKAAVEYGGDAAVACYAVISYAICVVQLLLQGVGDGAQPLFGNYFGSGRTAEMRKTLGIGYITALITAAAGIAALFAARGALPSLFGVSDGVKEDVSAALPIFLTGLIFHAAVRITVSYFSATNKNVFAGALVLGEPVLTLFAAIGLPKIFGLAGVWYSMPSVQFVLAAAAVILLALAAGRKKTRGNRGGTLV